MNKANEEAEKALQEWLESGLRDTDAATPIFDKKDVAAYSVLFEALNEKPFVALPGDFAEATVANLQAKRDSTIDFKWHFALLLVVLLLSGMVYLVLLYSHTGWVVEMQHWVFKFRWHVLFVTVCFFVFQYFDYRLWSRSPVKGM